MSVQAEAAITKAVQAGRAYMEDQDSVLCLRNAFDAMVEDVRCVWWLFAVPARRL